MYSPRARAVKALCLFLYLCLSVFICGPFLVRAADPPLHQAVTLQRPIATGTPASPWTGVVQTSAVAPPLPFPPPAIISRAAMDPLTGSSLSAAPPPPGLPPPTGGLPPLPPGTAPLPPPGAPPAPGLFSRIMNPGVITEPRFWVSSEYLMWWVKSGPVPVPLVTTGNTGIIGDPTTRVLFGDGNINYGMFSGLRVTAGAWVDPGQTFGLEASGFGLFNNSNSFQASSNAAGVPLIAVPVNSAFPVPGPVAIGSPQLAALGLPTVVGVSSSSQLWGWEADGVISLARAGFFHAEGLVGFRYLNLTEDLNLQLATSGGLPAGFFPPPFGGLPGVASASLTDGFSTRNQFYGANFGIRGGVKYGRVSLDGTFKVAMGPMHEIEQVVGFKTAAASAGGFNAVATAPGGIFAQPTNGGRQTSNSFAVVPEFILQLGVDVTSHWRVFVGYNFLYLSDVIRPGNQIDPTVNLAQLTSLGPVSPARPTPVFNHNDFWAQGINFGAEFRW